MKRENKLCKHCKYSRKPDKYSGMVLECIHPKNYAIKTNLVTGITEKTVKESWRISCTSQRDDNAVEALFNRSCGKGGKWFVKDLNKFKDEIKES
jgi:hypothetical protein